MARITGIGGVFLKSRDDAKLLAAWYRDHLGLRLEEFGGAVLEWKQDTAEDGGVTVWHVAEPDSDWFRPGSSPFMINYRIDDMNGMLERLQKAGVKIVKGPEAHENGRFVWILDLEGNKVELWEPRLWDETNKG